MRVLLTGASGGIGRALANELLGADAGVLLQARSTDRLGDLACHPRARVVAGDLRQDNDIAAIATAARENNINVLINNAGTGEFTLFEHSDIQRVIETNVIGTMALTQSLLPHLAEQPHALIINVGSTFGAIGYPGYVSYCASKHAIAGFSQALQRELSDTAIDVSYVAPRATRTAMNTGAADRANEALGVGSDSAEHVAAQIMKLIARKRRRLQLGSIERLQVTMNAMFPGVVDNAIAKQLPTIKRFVTSKEDS